MYHYSIRHNDYVIGTANGKRKAVNWLNAYIASHYDQTGGFWHWTNNNQVIRVTNKIETFTIERAY